MNFSNKNNNCGNKYYNLTMKCMSLDDFEIVRSWCKKESWNLGLHDASIYYEADKHGHYIFFENKIPVSSISLVKHSSIFFTIGTFIVKEKFRGKGYGDATWEKALTRLDSYPNASILLYAVAKQITRYEKHGFRSQYINKRWNIVVSNTLPANLQYQCKNITADFVKKISVYDKQSFSSSREKIFSELCNHHSIKGFVFEDDNIIKGYGIIRPCLTGYRIGPLIADSPEIAENIMASLLSISGSELVIIDIPDCNPNGDKLMQTFSAWRDPKFDTTAMVKGELSPNYKFNLDKNYGVFSLEIG